MHVRNVQESATKFKTRAGAAGEDYKRGVAGAGQRWQAGAEASEGAYEAGVQEAIGQKRFAAGVRRAGAQRYQDKATMLGPDRFRTGVAAAEGDWARGFAPHAAALSAFDPGPKGPRGSAQNYDRARRTAEHLRQTRIANLGAR
jgi:hypothetical protein